MKYSISQNNIILFNNGIINIPIDDLRFDSLKKKLLNNDFSNISDFLKLENFLPKGYNTINGDILVKDIKIPEEIINEYKLQLEELKNYIFDSNEEKIFLVKLKIKFF